MQLAVGFVHNRKNISVELHGVHRDASGATVAAGAYTFDKPITLTPASDDASFTVPDVTIGIGFHWERNERQSFRGGLRIIQTAGGLTAINDAELEDYVTSVISSEMSASCPLELLKAHAVISRSWVAFPKLVPQSGLGNATSRKPGELIRWYGREAHEHFDICADDHCQRYQGITKAFSSSVEQAVRATKGEMLTYNGTVCDARFSKSCGGLTEEYATAWDEQKIPYLVSFYDGPANAPVMSPEAWIQSSPPAYCNTTDGRLLKQILPNFDQETTDFYRWTVKYDPDELGEIVKQRLDVDLGRIVDLQPLARGPSSRLHRLKIVGSRDTLIVGKELEIRRALSRSHLYSSAFVVERSGEQFVLKGAGWGHGVGLCQIGAAVMANQGIGYREILSHYYPGTNL
jgi:SpoIID/LytB domain protein